MLRLRLVHQLVCSGPATLNCAWANMVAPNPPDGTADILLLPAKDQLVQGHPLELQAGSSQPPIHPKGSLTEIPLDSEDHVRGLAAHVQLSAPETVPPPLPTDLRGWRLVAVMFWCAASLPNTGSC